MPAIRQRIQDVRGSLDRETAPRVLEDARKAGRDALKKKAKGGGGFGQGAPPPQTAAAPSMADGEAEEAGGVRREASDVEQAVLGHGPSLGPYKEGIDKRLVRDAQFPIRITVQFYKATSNGVVSEKDLDLAARNIGSVYEHADFVGSLVIPEGRANNRRVEIIVSPKGK